MGQLTTDQYEHFSRVDTIDPVGINDATDGFELGNEWLNSITQRVFKLVGLPSPGNAAWKDTTEEGASNATVPGQIMYGTLLDYPFNGSMAKGEIQWLRLRVIAGTILSGASTFVDSGGNASRDVRLGIYDQADPDSTTADPLNRIVQTVSTPTTGGGTITANWIGGDFEITVTGYYWIALVVDSTTVKFAVSATHRSEFLPVRRADPGSTADLPDPAGAVTNPVSAVAFMTLVEA